MRERRASLADEERKKKEEERRKKTKIQFLLSPGSGCRRSFVKVFICIAVENYVAISMVRVRKLESAHSHRIKLTS